MVKIAILMKRRPGLSVEDFQDHLRTRYGPLVLRGPGLRRYVQSCALPQGYARGELLFDAVGEMWFDSLARLRALHSLAGIRPGARRGERVP